jgi:hypothetical protein
VWERKTEVRERKRKRKKVRKNEEFLDGERKQKDR